jgi:hypothetical protein
VCIRQFQGLFAAGEKIILTGHKKIASQTIAGLISFYIYGMRLIFSVVLFVSLFYANTPSFAQANNGPTIFHIQSSHTSFPDSSRFKGHVGDGVFYSVVDHYSDSSVLIIAPKNLDATKKVDMIFWFHGWHNNIDSAVAYYQLSRQFIASKMNAVLVLPEAAKDAADSYGGKLEKPGVFRALVGDVLKVLRDKKIIGEHCESGQILLGGHSGGGEAIAYIVENGNIEINEVVLFDALYGGTEKFMNWINADKTHRFIHLYTDYGYGPKDESLRMVKLLKQEQIPYFETEESILTPQEIQNHKLVYIHSLRQHNDIIFNPDNFKLLFENSPFLKKVKD